MKLSLEYIAGFFDGEGHVSITSTKRRTGNDPKLCVKITNTYLPVLNSIKDMYGGTIFANKKQYEHYLQCYVLSLSVKQSKKFLEDLIPLLVVKKRQAELALLFSTTVYRRGRKPVTQEEKDIRNYCMEEVRKEKLFEIVEECDD